MQNDPHMKAAAPKFNLFTREQVCEQILNFRARLIADEMENGTPEGALEIADVRVPCMLEQFLEVQDAE